tara:strand:+ start:573 stop:857 length:285 start_codon:yes stop_codon:yes gene_type:complete
VSPFEIKYGVFILSDGEIFHHREFHSKAEMKYYGDSQQEKFIEACWVDIGNSTYLFWIEKDESKIEWGDNFSTEALFLIKTYLFPDIEWMGKNV